MSYKPGDVVVFQGVGLGTVTGEKDGMVVIEQPTQKLMVPHAKVPILLRPPVQSTEAKKMMKTIKAQAPDPRPLSQRMTRISSTLSEGSLKDQSELLGQLMAGSSSSFSVMKMVVRVGDAVLSELSHALGVPKEDLEEQLKQHFETREPVDPAVPESP